LFRFEADWSAIQLLSNQILTVSHEVIRTFLGPATTFLKSDFREVELEKGSKTDELRREDGAHTLRRVIRSPMCASRVLLEPHTASKWFGKMEDLTHSPMVLRVKVAFSNPRGTALRNRDV